MSNLLAARPEVHFVPNMDQIDGSDSRLFGIGLVLMDVENVFVPLGGGEVDPLHSFTVKRLQKSGMKVVLASNMTDTGRIESITEQLRADGFVHKGMKVDGTTLASKSHPEMFRYAVERFGFGRGGTNAALFDDQLKNLRGMKQVPEFTDFFWTFPEYFFRQHPGVALMRPIEVPVGFGIISAQKTIKVPRAVHRFFKGTHGEW